MRGDKLLFGFVLVLLAWLPIPLGSDRVWAWSLFESAIFIAGAAWLLLWAFGCVRAGAAIRSAWPAGVVAAAWLAEQGVHLLPLAIAWVEVLSPEAARMQHLTDAIGMHRDAMTLSVDRFATRVAFLKGAAYCTLFFLVLAVASTRDRVRVLAQTMVYVSMCIAVYGVLMHLAGVRADLFGTVVDHASQARGTFVNRNHFAGHLEMTLALGIGLLIAGLTDRRADSWKRFAAHLIEWILSPKMLLRLALCILVIALTTTHSRMGNSAFFSSLIIAGVIGIALSRHAARNTVVLLVSLVVIDLAIVGSWFGMEKLAQRLEETTAGEVEVREEPAAYALGIIKDYPVFGAGPGSFYTVFPRYRPETVKAFYDHAHNDYAQFAAESGLVGLGILGLFVAISLWAAVRAQWLRRDPLMRGMSFACIMGVTSILIHSWVDFNLQIPANACYFMVLLALGWISLHLGRADARERPEERP